MCEFCTEHSEGRKWYLEMKHYSAELLNAKLAGHELALAGTETRLGWVQRFWRSFVLPAAGFKVKPEQWGSHVTAKNPAEDLANDKLVHFGQVIPMKDVEAVLDLGTSITRIPCGCRWRRRPLPAMLQPWRCGIERGQATFLTAMLPIE